MRSGSPVVEGIFTTSATAGVGGRHSAWREQAVKSVRGQESPRYNEGELPQ